MRIEKENAAYEAEKLSNHLLIAEGELTPLQRLFKHMYKDEVLRHHLNTAHWPDINLQLINSPFHIRHEKGNYIMETYQHDRIVIFECRTPQFLLDYLKGYINWNK